MDYVSYIFVKKQNKILGSDMFSYNVIVSLLRLLLVRATPTTKLIILLIEITYLNYFIKKIIDKIYKLIQNYLEKKKLKEEQRLEKKQEHDNLVLIYNEYYLNRRGIPRTLQDWLDDYIKKNGSPFPSCQ